MRRMAALIVMAVVVVACDVDTDTDMRDDAAAETGATEAEGGVPGAEDALPLPPDDGDVRTVEATLAEWSVSLAQDSVGAGAIAFNVRNAGSVVHRFEVEGNGEEWASEDINPGDDVTMSLTLTPGVYEVYCPIVTDGESHRAMGMTTALHVY